MSTFLFNGIDLSDYLKVSEIRGRGFAETEVDTLSVMGMNGVYVQSQRNPMRKLEVDASVIALNREDLRIKIDELNEILSVEQDVPIIFPDEPNMTYFGRPESTSQNAEYFFMHKGTITFLCSDPYKYGEEQTITFTNDVATIENEGTAEAEPIFELEVTAPITFAMIQNQKNEYMMIGQPVEDNIVVVDAKQLVLDDDGADLALWDYSPTQVDPTVGGISNGTFAYDGTGIIVDDYGDPIPDEPGFGPAIIREITPIQDFELEAIFDTRTGFYEENFRMEIYLFDEGMVNLGKIGIRDIFENLHNRGAMARVGPYNPDNDFYLIGNQNYNSDDNDFGTLSTFFFRWKREGNLFTFYVARIVDGKHVNTLTETYRDTSGQWTGRLKYVQLYTRTLQGRDLPDLVRYNRIKVYELTEITQDKTPYIAYPGDVITFDHKNEEMLLNGEDATSLKDFGASYFKFNKGDNQLIVHPANSFNTTLTYRNKYR